ncbi:MAG: hypothetical protein NZM27_10415 [Acetobacteraceae bacterium]|nr:hypothetical protein [Acetobacteraceae bacterium]MCX7686037.1 hypothetical protein [Acetobacteraceae bacterium]MDW8397589.1 hypothetical protein [Acetobacteraceae bacterium]
MRIGNLIASAFDDAPSGHAVANRPSRGDGNNLSLGAPWADRPQREAGADVFRLLAVSESSPTAPDRILDVALSERDRIGLSALGADGVAANGVTRSTLARAAGGRGGLHRRGQSAAGAAVGRRPAGIVVPALMRAAVAARPVPG